MAQLSWPVFILFRSYFRKTIFPDYIELTCPGLCGALFQINDCMSELTSPGLCGALFQINDCMSELTSPDLCGALFKKNKVQEAPHILTPHSAD